MNQTACGRSSCLPGFEVLLGIRTEEDFDRFLEAASKLRDDLQEDQFRLSASDRALAESELMGFVMG